MVGEIVRLIARLTALLDDPVAVVTLDDSFQLGARVCGLGKHQEMPGICSNGAVLRRGQLNEERAAGLFALADELLPRLG
jgi:hypothetical protein